MADEPKRPDLDDELTGSLSDGVTDTAPTELMSGHEAIRAARQIGPYRLIERNLGIARVRLASTAAEFAAAEATLLEAHAVTVELRGADHDRARETAGALADLYEAWEKVEPGSGHDASSLEWSAKGGAAV